MSLRGLVCLGAALVQTGAWSADPQYRVKYETKVQTPGPIEYGFITSFNNDDAIMAGFSNQFGGSKSYTRMYSGPNVLNIGIYWGYSVGSEWGAFRNNAGVFSHGTNKYRMTLDSPIQTFPTSLGYSYFEGNGITDTGWIYGRQRGIQNNADLGFTDAFNVYTGQRLFPFGNSIRRMSNSGAMLVETLEPKFGDPRTYMLKDGVTTVFGDFEIQATPFNDLDQFAGTIGWATDLGLIDKPVFWDGVHLNYIPYLNFRPDGMSNLGRIIGGNVMTGRREIYENGQIYDLIDHTNGWDAGMSIYKVMTRPDGDIAVIGRKGTDFYVLQLQSVPEPLTLFGLGAGLALVARRRR